jgi:diacylglycerol kinase family enzyme
MLCGIGFDAQVAHDFAKQPRRGLRTYIKVSLKHFLRARCYSFQIDLSETDNGGPSFPVEAFFIDIANGNQFGNHVTIAPQASLHDGLLDVVIVKKANRLRLLSAAIGQVLGGYGITTTPVNAGAKKVLYFQTTRLVISNPDAAPLHVDGDPARSAGVFRIEVVPEAIRLIQP